MGSRGNSTEGKTGTWLNHGLTEDGTGDRDMWSSLVLDEGNHCTVDSLYMNEMNEKQ
jgi:hypothetical protein